MRVLLLPQSQLIDITRQIIMYPNPPPRPDPFVRRLTSVTLAVIGLMLLWWSLPMIESLFAPRDGGIRTVIARGDLAADELATIELFEKSRDSVVFITTARLVRDL